MCCSSCSIKLFFLNQHKLQVGEGVLIHDLLSQIIVKMEKMESNKRPVRQTKINKKYINENFVVEKQKLKKKVADTKKNIKINTVAKTGSRQTGVDRRRSVADSRRTIDSQGTVADRNGNKKLNRKKTKQENRKPEKKKSSPLKDAKCRSKYYIDCTGMADIIDVCELVGILKYSIYTRLVRKRFRLEETYGLTCNIWSFGKLCSVVKLSRFNKYSPFVC